ncbi:hypothetical protein ACT4ZL_12020 [Acinetobacter baumannii]|nr:hypothetical protein [Acinetobacter baumannii]
MTFLDEVLKAIGANTNSLIIKQNFNFFSCKGEIGTPAEKIGEKLTQLLLWLKEKHNIYLLVSLKNGFNDAVNFSTESLDSFSDKEQLFLDNYDEGEATTFTIESGGWDKLNLFSLKDFLITLNTMTLNELLQSWSEYFNSNNYMVINLFESNRCFSSRFLYINCVYPDSNEDLLKKWLEKVDTKLLEDKIESRDKVGHFVNADKLRFIPECFDFKEDFILKNHFDYLKTIFIILFLSDYSSISGNTLSFKIKGYKTLNCKVDCKLPLDVEKELFNIYEWVYDKGPFVDKIGIARNVISIHLLDENIATLEKGTCHSAQSGYDLYLKENVKQYIEVKNKIADALYTQSEKASGIVKDMFAMFKTSMLTFLSFFLMSFLVKIIEGKTKSISLIEVLNFNLPTVIIGFSLVLISLFYLLFARKEVSDETKRLINKYNEIENRYKDLLNENDLKKILTQSNVDGKSAKEIELSYISKKKKLYTKYWILVIVVLIIILMIPYYSKIYNFINCYLIYNNFSMKH